MEGYNHSIETGLREASIESIVVFGVIILYRMCNLFVGFGVWGKIRLKVAGAHLCLCTNDISSPNEVFDLTLVPIKKTG